MINEKKAKVMEKQLRMLVKKNGHVTPSMLIKVSADKKSPTHDCFTWDDKKCGEEYRLIEARHWIRTVKVTVENKEDQVIQVSLAHVPSESGKGEGEYKPVNVIVDSPSEFERALNAAILDLESAQRRVGELKDAASAMGDKDKSALLASLALTLSTARGILEKMQ